MSADLHDLVAHRRAWLDALVIARDSFNSERSYWVHEINAFNRAFDQIEAALVAPVAVPPVSDATSAILGGLAQMLDLP